MVSERIELPTTQLLVNLSQVNGRDNQLHLNIEENIYK